MNFRRSRRRETPETLLPLINVVFLLLIFFMLLANLSAYVPFPVTPPDAATATADRTGLTIALSADGRLALDGRDVDDAALIAQIAGRQSGGQLPPVWLRADRNADSDRVIALMERLRAAGVTEVRLIASR